MTTYDQGNFDRATTCYLCKGEFDPERQSTSKVRDHNHLTGAYRGAAHSKCNLRLRQLYRIPVFFHNFRGYDAHLLVWGLAVQNGGKIEVIGQGLEKYLMIQYGKHLQFKDSCRLMNGSLDRLSQDLVKSEKKLGDRKFNYVWDDFHLSGEILNQSKKYDLLCQKGVYPYDWMDNAEKLDLPSLPPQTCFDNSLRKEKCCDEDYKRAQEVWQVFGFKSFRDYHEHYLKCM